MEVDEVEALLREILARPEYVPAEPPILVRWLNAAMRWLGDVLSPVFRRVIPDLDWSSPGWATVGYLLLGIGALLGLAVLGYIVWLGVRAYRGRRRRRRADPAAAAAPATARDWEAAARAAAAAEDWRGAAMALYQAVLLRLGDAGVLRVDRSKTPGDYRRELRRQRAGPDPELAPRFERFLRGFERVAFGPGSPGREQYEHLLEAAGGLGPRG